MEHWGDVLLSPEFSERGTDCYKLKGGDFLNEYFVVSEAAARNLLNTPEVAGYEVYLSLVPATSVMMNYFKRNHKITRANILSILRGALNYPLEEACWRENILVNDISFLSCERVFHGDEITGLDIRYHKLAIVPDSTLMIGDIIASGATMIHCLKGVIEEYRKRGQKLKNIIFFTIGAKKGIEILENFTKEIRQFWPEFEGFLAIYYEGIFNCYTDKGTAGIQVPDVDFYWKGGIISPEFRRQTISAGLPLFEKCTIYDGGARRYEISQHIREVCEYWEGMKERAGIIDWKAFVEEKLGYSVPVSLEDWIKTCHYTLLSKNLSESLYELEQEFVQDALKMDLAEIADKRLSEFTNKLHEYMI